MQTFEHVWNKKSLLEAGTKRNKQRKKTNHFVKNFRSQHARLFREQHELNILKDRRMSCLRKPQAVYAESEAC